MKLEGKVALVTGSSQGIGQAIAVRLAQEGADIVINYRGHPEGAQETLTKVEATGRKGLTVKADLGVVSDVRRMVAEGIQHFGKLDILVNNAGLEKNASFWEVTEADYEGVLNVNLKGVFFATQALVQHLMETKRPGKIINISSVHEELPFPHFTSYCASKGGVKMMMRQPDICRVVTRKPDHTSAAEGCSGVLCPVPAYLPRSAPSCPRPSTVSGTLRWESASA